MKRLNIDNEFKTLIPPLASDEYDQLAKNLIDEGCRDALVVWNDTILDGHNRYSICLENKIPYAVKEMDFETREEAIEWIIRNQFGRRNLSNVARVKLALKLKDVIQERAKKNLTLSEGRGQKGSQELGKVKEVHTNKELGKIAGVSDETIRKYEVIQREGTDEIKKEVDSGEKSIHKGYEVTKPKLEVVEVEEETKKCSICGRDKPLSEYYSERQADCKKCNVERKRAGITANEARELNEFVSDEVFERYYQEMKNPPPKTVGSESSSNNNLNPIIAELGVLLKNISAGINKYTFMGEQETNNGTKNLIESIIEDLTKINSKIKE